MMKKLVIAMVVALMAFTAASARELEDVEMPEVAVVKDTPLVLNGAGVRKVMFFKFYVGGLYLEEAETDAQKVIEAAEPMALRLHMIDDVKKDTMRDACLSGFKNTTNNNIEPIKDGVDKFLGCFSEPIKEGDIFSFKYHPDCGVKVYKFDEHRATIEGLDFKKAMFGIWLCGKPADKNLKKSMLEGSVSEEALALQKKKRAEIKKEKAGKAKGAAGSAVEKAGKAKEAAGSAVEKAEEVMQEKEDELREKALNPGEGE